MPSNKQITVSGIQIGVVSHKNQDYICLTDLVKSEEGNDHIRNWMRNRNTVEFLGIWEQLNNPDFKGVEFDTFKKQAGLNSFNLTPKKWIDTTNAIGLISKAGRNGGTYAHKDLAFEFATWFNPVFKLYLIKEFQRLKEIESNEHNVEWNVRRIVSKANAHIHNDAVKRHIIPNSHLPKNRQGIEYANETDLLNIAVFGCTAQQWRDNNPELHLSRQNMRDTASINELTILSNLEVVNSMLIKQGIPKSERLDYLLQTATEQMSIMDANYPVRALKKVSEDVFLDAKETQDD